MDDTITILVESLREEAARYRNLKLLAEQQKELLVAGLVDALPENVRLEEKEVFALGPLVARRNEMLAKMAKAHRLASMDLKGAIEKAPLESVEELKAAVLDLASAAQKLEETNRGNEKLLNNALSYVNFSLKLITSGGKRKHFLPSPAAEEKRPSFVDRVV